MQTVFTHLFVNVTEPAADWTGATDEQSLASAATEP